MVKIDIYRDQHGARELLGAITRGEGGATSFKYDDAYLSSSVPRGELGISERLPLSDAAYGQSDIGSAKRMRVLGDFIGL